ncbi:hypothetical protein BM536_024505 [Streptomyces phaeoluteigriseus]|uniref:Uncharacterized protein n=1 Tax=Streptomyces phaeoluteigriseus TaxID=114686 RepID=A0A1V6MRA3_9ACTN|nr:hypothetical protein BM536_024505 [Streptomyces phaeoluteigriseus]
MRRVRSHSVSRGPASGTRTPTTVRSAPSPAATGEVSVTRVDQSWPVQRAATAESLARLYTVPHSAPRPSVTRPVCSRPRTSRAQRSAETAVTPAAARCPSR